MTIFRLVIEEASQPSTNEVVLPSVKGLIETCLKRIFFSDRNIATLKNGEKIQERQLKSFATSFRFGVQKSVNFDTLF